MNTEPTDPATGVAKKAPRKPRPSEIAAKKAKAAKKSKRKPAPKKKAKAKPRKAVKRPAKPKARKTKAVQWSAARACRMDVRMSKAQKRKLDAKAKAKGRTVTSMILEAVDKLR